jgi:Protein of unknown function (DUF3060)
VWQASTITLCLGICLCVTAPAAAQHRVTSSGEQRTIECGGQTVSVSGSKNDLTLRGDCPRVDVAGVGNTVAIEGAGAIEVTGTGNRVTWQRALKGEAPRVSTTGLNSVQRAAGAASAQRAPKDQGPASNRPAKPGSAETSPSAAGTEAKKAPTNPGSPEKPSSEPPSRQTRPQTPKPTGSSQSYSSTSQEVSVLTDNNEDVIECKGRKVRVMGDENRLELRGDCPDVSVSGDKNVLSVEIATRIQLTGDDNELSWARAAVGSEPRISIPGDRNRVTHRVP